MSMRDFSIYEKKVIREIITTDLLKSNILEVISKIVLIDRGIEIKQNIKEISLLYFKKDKTALSEFFEVIALLNYLEKNDLIFIHSNYDSPYQGNFISKNITQTLVNERSQELLNQRIPTNIYEFIIRYKDSYLIVGTELKKLVENDFKTSEQIQHETELVESKKQTKLSQYSFYIALVALIFSLLAPFIFDTKFDKNQMNSIKQVLNNNSSNEIKELEKNRKELKIITDSIKIKVQTPNKSYK